MNPRRSLSFSL